MNNKTILCFLTPNNGTKQMKNKKKPKNKI